MDLAQLYHRLVLWIGDGTGAFTRVNIQTGNNSTRMMFRLGDPDDDGDSLDFCTGVDSAPWMLQVWAAFSIALLLTGWGLLRMNIGPWEQAYMFATWLYLISAAFTLQKTIRDKHEADLVEQPAAAE